MNPKVARKIPVFQRIELAACTLMVAWALALIGTEMLSAGPLWRDEINTLWMSLRSSFSELWAWLDKDSFPLVWYMVIRAWVAVGIGQTDQGLRSLGALVGVGQLALLFWVARLQGKRPPLLLVGLFALSPFLFVFGTSMRAYGMGIATMFLMIGFVWRYIDRPTARGFVFSLLLSLLAVQTLYYNAIILFVLCCAGAIIFAASKRYSKILQLGIIGLVPAISIMPYIFGPMSRAKEWTSTVTKSEDLMSRVNRLFAAIDLPGRGLILVWILLGLAVYLGCAWGFFRWHSSRRRNRALFILIAAPVLFIVHFGFLSLLGYVTQPWYFITLVVFSALMIDRGADMIIRRRTLGRIIRLAVVGLVIVMTLNGNWMQAHLRRTSIDLVAQTITDHADKNDLVLVAPWYYGVSFARYYQGEAPWLSIPVIGDWRIHRYDLYKQAIMHPETFGTIKAKIAQTLDSGHHVWFVGYPSFPQEGRIPDPIPVAPTRGWDQGSYDPAWLENVSYEFMQHGDGVHQITITNLPISGFESAPLFVIDPKPR